MMFRMQAFPSQYLLANRILLFDPHFLFVFRGVATCVWFACVCVCGGGRECFKIRKVCGKELFDIFQPLQEKQVGKMTGTTSHTLGYLV